MRLLRSIWSVVSSRATSPLVIGFFLVLYIVIAFFTENALTTLMEFTRTSVVLAAVLVLLPLNSAGRLVTETAGYLRRRRVMNGREADVPPGMFDETVELAAPPIAVEMEDRLGVRGYKTRRTDGTLVAWRGFNIFPARGLYLLGTFCLFAGILVSFTTRASFRGNVVEGEILATPSGTGGMVERIRLEKNSGLFLANNLTMEVAPSGSGEARHVFGVYPPSRYRGVFVYPRFLGIALVVRFSAPDLAGGTEKYAVLNIYPPGKEAPMDIPGTPYRLVISMAEPGDGTDPFKTGRMVFLFKLLKGNEVLVSGSAPGGGAFVRDGYTVAFPDFRRMVVTDFIRDYGVLLIWTAAVLFMAAACLWLPTRLFFPRREMLFVSGPDEVRSYSRAEGEERKHGGVFHEMLDSIAGTGT